MDLYKKTKRKSLKKIILEGHSLPARRGRKTNSTILLICRCFLADYFADLNS